MNRSSKILLSLIFCVGSLLFSGCSVTKYANVGLDLDYYGGEFHVRPNASVGVSGHK